MKLINKVNLKKLAIMLTFLLAANVVFRQTFLDITYTHSDLTKIKPMNDINLFSMKSSFGIELGSGIYLAFQAKYINIKDKILSGNEYSDYILGAKAGWRFLSPFVISRFQPIVEGEYHYKIVDVDSPDPTLRSMYGYGGGFEYYFSDRSAIVTILSNDYYNFIGDNLVSFLSLNIGVRFGLNWP